MSKKKDEAKQETKTQPELNNTALSLVKKNGKFSLVRIKFNLEEQQLSLPEVLKDDMGTEEAREVFRIQVVKDGLFS